LLDLPSTRKATAFAAVNSRFAPLALPIPYGYQSTYETSDGGTTWKEIDLPTPTQTPAEVD
jgi:hypothetical protein